jgi:hypothetical protein
MMYGGQQTMYYHLTTDYTSVSLSYPWHTCLTSFSAMAAVRHVRFLALCVILLALVTFGSVLQC